MNLLLLSSSKAENGTYLEHARAWIRESIGNKELLFIPFAGVSIDWDTYLERVREALAPVGISVCSIHKAIDAKAALRDAQAIAVGGGNTFHLLKTIYDWDLLDLIKEKVQAGTPYIGWSAGSNIAAPTICTTNDMPIVQPKRFDALGLVPFQINPHYSDFTPPNFHGETRAQRLEEFLLANPNKRVIALPEGTALARHGDKLSKRGHADLLYFQYKKAVQTLKLSDISELLIE